MAWIRKRRRNDGGITYVVTWREPGDTKESTISIKDDLAKAELNVRLLDANGQSFAAAKRSQENAKIGGPSLIDSMLRHISTLVGVEDETVRRYRSMARDHFKGNFGNLPVAAVEHDDVITWIRYMQAKPSKKRPGQGYSAKSIWGYHALLSATMESAIRLGFRTSNPCRGIKLPKESATEEKMRFMTAEESLAIVRTLPLRYQPLMMALRGTGMRWGEATALYAKDFKLDVSPPSVRIERAWKGDGHGGLYIGPPKTKKSRRTISLPPSLVAEIRPLVEAAQADGGFVFRDDDGIQIRQSRFFNHWKRALTELDYPEETGERPRIHDMRHTHASLMLGGGFEIFKLSRRLGHESIQTTVDRYSHLTPDAHFQGAEIAENVLSVEAVPEVSIVEAA